MREDIIIGRNAVESALKEGRKIERVLVKEGEKNGSVPKLIYDLRRAGISVSETSKRKLDEISEHGVHQGVIAFVPAKEYASVDDIFSEAESKNQPPFIVICDKITDPHNLGSIIRTAGAAGAHGVIIPKHESVGLNATVCKVAAGAAEFVKVAKVGNIAKTIDDIKKRGVWVTGADMYGEKTLFNADMSGSVAIVIGSEGTGISELVKKKCDFLVNIPMPGKTESLNASVAAALMIYEVARNRAK